MTEPVEPPPLSIGEFARRSRLSLKALRLYERRGLLQPARVDPHTGYRWYRESQLYTARLIAMLRLVDMPLAQVADVVSGSEERGAELVAAHWDAVEHRVDWQRELVELLRTSLRDREPRSGGFEVRERAVPEQLVLAEQRSLSLAELEGWLRATKRRLVAAAHGYGGMVAPLFVIFHGEVSQDSDGPVEVCVPVDRARAVARDPALRREPAHREAYVRVTKAQFEVPQILSAYDAVAAWISAHGRCWAGPPREVYLPGVDPHGAAPTDEVCDVACPVDSRA
jgi:DNA-binding transcriptional MerR regulator